MSTLECPPSSVTHLQPLLFEPDHREAEIEQNRRRWGVPYFPASARFLAARFFAPIAFALSFALSRDA